MRRPRVLLATLFAALLAFPLLGVPAAAAATESALCTGTETYTYEPGLRLSPQTVRVTGGATFNKGVTTIPQITSGTAMIPPAGLVAELSCLNLLNVGTNQAAIRWNDGSLSRYTYTIFTNTVAGQLITVTNGKIVDGPFVGQSIRWVM